MHLSKIREVVNKPRRTILHFPNVKTFNISLENSRISNLWLVEESTIEVIPKILSFYWLDTSTDRKIAIPNISTFLTKDDVVKISGNDLSFGLSSLKVSLGKPDTQSRSVRYALTVDGVKKAVNLVPSGRLAEGTFAECSEAPGLTVNSDENEFDLSLSDVALGATLWVDVTESNADGSFVTDKSQLKIENANGWLNVEAKADSKEYEGSLGDTGIISFSEAGSDVWIDGVKQEARSSGTYLIAGSLRGQYDGPNKVHLVGFGDSVWRNNSRINPTRWERMEIELKVMLLTAFGALGMLLIRWMYSARSEIFAEVNSELQ